MALKVDIHELKSRLSQLLKQIEAGDEVEITRAGQPLARIVPFVAGRKLGTAKGDFVVPHDVDSGLPDGVLREFKK